MCLTQYDRLSQQQFQFTRAVLDKTCCEHDCWSGERVISEAINKRRRSLMVCVDAEVYNLEQAYVENSVFRLLL